MHHILSLDSHQALDELLKDEAGFHLGQVAVPGLNEAIDIAAVAVFHDQVVIRLRLRSGDEPHHVAVLNLSHNLDLVHKQLMVFAFYSLSVDHLHSVELIRVLSQVAVVDGAVLASTQDFGR